MLQDPYMVGHCDICSWICSQIAQPPHIHPAEMLATSESEISQFTVIEHITVLNKKTTQNN